MALLEQKHKNIYVWRNTETSQELLVALGNDSTYKEKIKDFKSEERIKQYLTNRLLLKEVLGKYKLKKGQNNKPFLEGSQLEISFSHNKKFTVLMTSKYSCGVDVQVPTEKAVRVKSKFINSGDFCFESNDLKTLSKAWSCKEAAFKKFGNHEIFLKENITIIRELEKNQYEVLVTFEKEHHNIILQGEEIEGNYLFYTIN